MNYSSWFQIDTKFYGFQSYINVGQENICCHKHFLLLFSIIDYTNYCINIYLPSSLSPQQFLGHGPRHPIRVHAHRLYLHVHLLHSSHATCPSRQGCAIISLPLHILVHIHLNRSQIFKVVFEKYIFVYIQNLKKTY
jgi:hypothetical protein